MTKAPQSARQQQHKRWARLAQTIGLVLPLLLAACASTDHGAGESAKYRLARADAGSSQSHVLQMTPSIDLTARPDLIDAAPPGAGPRPGWPTPPTPLPTPAIVTESDAAPPPAASDDTTSGGDAVGQPTDPLEPEKTIALGDTTAKVDLWGRIRQGFAVPNIEGDLVREHERWYAARPDYVQRMTERSSRYLFHIVEEIERRKMPTELALLPFIESAFNPRAMSSAKASGMWQFVPATGRTFDLKQNVFRDDRRDVLASTRAALDYLQRLYGMFGDWRLALAAYNWGEGNVQRAIAHNQRRGLPTDYASLNMPPETRNYVPKLQAVKNIVSQPDAFRLSLPVIENHPYFISVPIQRDMDVSLAAKLAGLSTDDFHDLNPSFNKPVILAAGTPQVLLPYENAEYFVKSLQAHTGPLASWTAWTVPKTMRPAEAAKQAGMSEASLREVNRIPPKMLVKAGSTLLVPRSRQREADVTEAVADNAIISLAPDQPPMRRSFVRAGKRDTLASVARRNRVSAAQLAQWNRLQPNARLTTGQQLAIYTSVRGVSRTVASARRVQPQHARRVASGGHRNRVATASRSRGGKATGRYRGQRVASVN